VPIQSVTTRGPKMEGPEGDAGGAEAEVVVDGGQNAKPKQEMKPKEVVFVLENGVVKAKPVKRGIANASHVEILEGLNEGAEVVSGSYKAINRELEDGTKVRIEEQKKRPGRAQGANA